MLKRTLVTGVAVLATAGAVTPNAMAGEDDQAAPPPAPPPVTETVPAPPPPPVTVTVPAPAPPPVTVTTPAPQPLNETQKGGGSSGGSESGGSTSNDTKPSRPRVVVRYRTVYVSTGHDTTTVPSGGIQAGAGGTASDGHTPLTLGLGSGALAFLLTAGGLARRRIRSQS